MCHALRVRVGWMALLSVGSAAPVCAQQLKSTLITSGLHFPVGVTAPSGDPHRLFVLELAGTIRIIRDGVLLSTPFLDIQSEVTTGIEGGLTGIAFHPDYATNGRFFVCFVENVHQTPLLREYHVSANPDRADPASGIDVLAHFRFLNPSGHVHYGGDIHFGPDGMLYYSLGDHDRLDLSPDLTAYNGKLLRLDIDIPPPHVPVDNPYPAPNDGGLDLIWACGLRNPWRFAFDRGTGDLYIGDVGRADREEIDFQPANAGSPGSPGYEGGRDYGWPCMEGSECTLNQQANCVCDTTGATLVLPTYEVRHGPQLSAIIGGFVYRGSAIPGLQGQYFCADYKRDIITSFSVVNGQVTHVQDRTAELNAGLPQHFSGVASFGEDASGELYFTTLAGAGQLFRIDPQAPSCTAPIAYCATSPNSVGSGAAMSSTGSASISTPEFVLVSESAPPHILGAFRCGTQEVQTPFGNGWSCVAGSVVRLPFLSTDVHGRAAQPLDYSLISVSPGQTRDFQFLYRDSAGGGSQFNLSDGLRIVFCP